MKIDTDSIRISGTQLAGQTVYVDVHAPPESTGYVLAVDCYPAFHACALVRLDKYAVRLVVGPTRQWLDEWAEVAGVTLLPVDLAALATDDE